MATFDVVAIFVRCQRETFNAELSAYHATDTISYNYTAELQKPQLQLCR